MKNKINEIFNSLRNEFVIIGLTGAVGSGCTTVASLLEKKYSTDEMNQFISNYSCENKFDLEYRKLLRVKQFYSSNEWKNFYNIKVSNLLLLLLIAHIDDFEQIPQICDFISNNEMSGDISKIFKKQEKNDLKKLADRFINAINNYDSSNENMTDILESTNRLIEKNIEKDNEIYTSLFQALGENIRNHASIFVKKKNDSIYNKLSKFTNQDLPIFIIPEMIRRVIKLLRITLKKPHFFVIDALRNSYEIEFFRNRYQSFYLFSILASESCRKERISKDFNLSETEIKKIRDFEINPRGIASQTINTCIGKGDIFINNNVQCSSKTNLLQQLIKYIALIRKPGLVTPTDDERFMQVAFTARYNSGCISRQVGAAVIGANGYLMGFGWNDVPEKHVPCLYRTPQQLLSNSSNSIFSTYEQSDSFYKHLEISLKDYTFKKELPFCFKDYQNDIELDKKTNNIFDKKIANFPEEKEIIKKILKESKLKNPTRERALHAEENAFLQITKSGGQSVVGGTLYTTDSPCQLCSKKAMQLKMKRIVYIDAYPDISEAHTLKAGEKEQWPEFDMFSGAIGAAYFKLFIPIVGIKDEIDMLKE